MSKRDVKTGQESESGAIGVRPPKYLRPQLRQLAAVLDYSEGQLLYRCAEAIIGMVQADQPAIPRIVTRARILQKYGGTFTDSERPFPQEDTRVLRVPRQSTGAEDGKRNPRKGDKPNGPAKVKT